MAGGSCLWAIITSTHLHLYPMYSANHEEMNSKQWTRTPTQNKPYTLKGVLTHVTPEVSTKSMNDSRRVIPLLDCNNEGSPRRTPPRQQQRQTRVSQSWPRAGGAGTLGSRTPRRRPRAPPAGWIQQLLLSPAELRS